MAKLISKEYGRRSAEIGEYRPVQLGQISIGGDEPIFIAGPCAVESKQQLFKIAAGIKKAGAHILRGGIFKPRSSVHAFQGLGASHLIVYHHRRQFHKVVINLCPPSRLTLNYGHVSEILHRLPAVTTLRASVGE